ASASSRVSGQGSARRNAKLDRVCRDRTPLAVPVDGYAVLSVHLGQRDEDGVAALRRRLADSPAIDEKLDGRRVRSECGGSRTFDPEPDAERVVGFHDPATISVGPDGVQRLDSQ